MTEKYNQDGSISQNWLAEEIAKREEGKIEVNIAQIKDVLNDTLDILSGLQTNEPDKIDELLGKHIS